MMRNNAHTKAARADALLDDAHRDYAALRDRREALIRFGIGSDHLPNEVTLMAFALLGDHDRADVAADLETHWESLQSKGLVRGAIADLPTPELRLLAHVQPLTDGIEDVWQRLQGAAQVPEAPHGVLRCASRVQGLWGQLARLHFSAKDAAYVLISSDPIFGLQPALLAADRSGQCAGCFSFPVDDGEIRLTLLQRSGDVFRHSVRGVVEGLT